MRNRISLTLALFVAMLAVTGLRWTSAEGPDRATLDEFKAKNDAATRQQIDGRLELAKWCIASDLLDEAIVQLRLASLMDPDGARDAELWKKLAAKLPRAQAGVTLTTDDGNVLRGTCSPPPFLVRTDGGMTVIPVDRMKSATWVEDKGAEALFAIDTWDGEVRGTFIDPALVVTSALGELTVPLRKVRKFTVDSLSKAAPVTDASTPIRCCLDALSRANDPFAMFGAAQSCSGDDRRDEIRTTARNTMKGAAGVIEKDRIKYPALRQTDPVDLYRIVLKDGKELIADVGARSATVIGVRVLSDKGWESRQLASAEIDRMEVVKVPAEQVNRATQARLCADFAAACEAGQYVALLSTWGKLCHEFPDQGWSPTLAAVLRERGVKDATPRAAVDGAVAWAARICPDCMGSMKHACKMCQSTGKVKAEEVCPVCGGAEPAQCDFCGGQGTLTCGRCGGTGGTVGNVGGLTFKEPCERCAGKGWVRCSHCKNGVVVCGRCGNKGKVTLEKPCAGCDGKGSIACSLCGGKGTRPEGKIDAPQPDAPVTAPGPASYTATDNPNIAEWRTRVQSINKEQSQARIQLALWCIGKKLLGEGQQQLKVATSVDPANPALVGAWEDMAEIMPRRQVLVSLTMKDDNVIKGTCSPRPFVLVSKSDVVLIPLWEVLDLKLNGVDRQVEVTTIIGTFQGTLAAAPLIVKTSVGDFTVPFDQVKAFSVDVPGEARPKPPAVGEGPATPPTPTPPDVVVKPPPPPPTPTPEATRPDPVNDWDANLAELKAKGLDVVIVFDATGSMGPCIIQMKTGIRPFMTALTSVVPGARVGLVAYRDSRQYDADDYQFTVKFTALKGADPAGVSALMRFLLEIEAYGGGDIPEAVLEGVQTAVDKAQWRPEARKVIIVFGDAPPHPEGGGLARTYAACSVWQKKSGGVLSCIDTSGAARVMPEFVRMAANGGGEAGRLNGPRELLKQLLVYSFGSKWKDKIEAAAEGLH